MKYVGAILKSQTYMLLCSSWILRMIFFFFFFLILQGAWPLLPLNWSATRGTGIVLHVTRGSANLSGKGLRAQVDYVKESYV
jgi:hypothetical protein